MNREDKVRAESVKAVDTTELERKRRERAREKWRLIRLEEVEQELAKANVYWFVNRPVFASRERRMATLGTQMILPRDFKELLDPLTVELFVMEKEPRYSDDVNLTEKDALQTLLRSTRFHALEELVAMNKVYVEESKSEGKKRYLAVVERDQDMICEITKEAFDTLLKTDIVEETKKKMKRRQQDRDIYTRHYYASLDDTP
jgi:hypothetical protein